MVTLTWFLSAKNVCGQMGLCGQFNESLFRKNSQNVWMSSWRIPWSWAVLMKMFIQYTGPGLRLMYLQKTLDLLEATSEHVICTIWHFQIDT